MIKARDLSISFNGREVFYDANFIINSFEKVGLIGRNGSGKSTFLKLILKKLEVFCFNAINTNNKNCFL